MNNRKQINIHCFIEEKEALLLDTTIPEYLIENGYCIKNEQEVVFKICGFYIAKNDFFIILPKGVNSSLIDTPSTNSYLHTLVVNLIKSLQRYYNEDVNRELENTFCQNSSTNFPLEPLLEILDDYINNGELINYKTTYSKSNIGRINWKKTINKCSPYMVNNQLVYLDFIIQKNKIDLENIIYKIYKSTLEKAVSYLGWMFNIDISIEEDSLNHDYQEIINILNIQLQSVYTDRELRIYKALLSYYKGIEDNKSTARDTDSIFFFSSHFHTVWEKICHTLLKGEALEKYNIPRPYWKIGESEKQYTKQIPDILFTHDSDLYIVDAKYYSLTKLPGWPDLVKQFFYNLTLTQYRNKTNIFILPSSHQDTFIKYYGFADVEQSENFGLDKIHAFTMDVYQALNHYGNYHNGYQLQSDFVDTVTKKIERDESNN